MLTRLRIRNFKRFSEIDVELGKIVVLIGPNNSGKTTALQSLALWELGRDRWLERRSGDDSPQKRPGVTINRQDLVALPVPDASQLWCNLHKRDTDRVNGKKHTQNIRIGITVDGITEGEPWSCGFEFDYSNAESFVCRPIREAGHEGTRVEDAQFTSVPKAALGVRVAFLPPMSGLAAIEPKLLPGRIKVLIGEGQTAQVLRNLCHEIHAGEHGTQWQRLIDQIQQLFGVEIQPPRLSAARGEITMEYAELGGTRLDLSCAGRGLQQTLLLLAHLYTNPHTLLLLDEPDAHLEILRQRQIYQVITETADQQGCQIIIASHSEVVLNEAAEKDMVIAFVGRPHRMDDRGSQVKKALSSIGFEHYYEAEETGWVLYLEGATDLAILRSFAQALQHPARSALDRPFFVPVGTNEPQRAREHFYGLREAKADLVGIAIFDRLQKDPRSGEALEERMWRRREIENYLCTEPVLLSYAKHDLPEDDLFSRAESSRREALMREAISEVSDALRTLKKPGPWSEDIKASDDFLDIVFEKFFEKLGIPNQMRKSNYHQLASLVRVEQIPEEIIEKLDAILAVSRRATPRQD